MVPFPLPTESKINAMQLQVPRQVLACTKPCWRLADKALAKLAPGNRVFDTSCNAFAGNKCNLILTILIIIVKGVKSSLKRNQDGCFDPETKILMSMQLQSYKIHKIW